MSKPVEAGEVEEVVLKALAKAFAGRLLTWQVATQGLAHAGFSIKEMHLREVAAASAKKGKGEKT